MRKLLLLALAVVVGGRSQEAKEGTPGDAQRVVTIRRIVVEGTRLLSLIGLAQIKARDEVNFVELRNAMNKVTATGLIANIDFE